VTPDQAAERLQLEERGTDLLKRCDEDPQIFKAIQMILAGFEPKVVAETYNLDFDEAEVEQEAEGEIKVWECTTNRCRQKGRVSTASEVPNCPSCRQEMSYVTSVMHPEEVSHMRKTFIPDPGLADPLARTDRTRSEEGMRGDDDG
jgi:hypothetical protein